MILLFLSYPTLSYFAEGFKVITSDIKLYHYIIKAHKNNDLSSFNNYVLDKHRAGSSPCGETR